MTPQTTSVSTSAPVSEPFRVSVVPSIPKDEECSFVKDSADPTAFSRSSALSSSVDLTTPRFGLVGSGPAMTKLVQCIEQVASTRAAVLIQGETGSGKDLVARAIHSHGPLHDRPLVIVNVAAIPEPLLDSEIFGHVRGAFTGATQARLGLFASANGGTLFLDEVGDMPLVLQAKLLRVLESGELRPVGGDTVRNVDVRIIAATNRDLSALIAENRFREDLYFRLSVLPVAVPPLRDRREDIADLTMYFFAAARKRMPHSIVRAISQEAIDVLAGAAWPGNVRELASVVERLVAFASKELITPLDLPFASEHKAKAHPLTSVPLLTLRQVSEHYIDHVLTYTAGNKKWAADILGIDLSTLYRWQADGRKRGSLSRRI